MNPTPAKYANDGMKCSNKNEELQLGALDTRSEVVQRRLVLDFTYQSGTLLHIEENSILTTLLGAGTLARTTGIYQKHVNPVSALPTICVENT